MLYKHFRRCTDLPACPEEVRGVRDLGWMLLDMDYIEPESITPRFFRATMTDGTILVPLMDGEELRG